MDHHAPRHLAIGREHVAGNDGAGRVFLLPGSDGRSRRIGERLRDHEVVPSDRQLNVHLGRQAASGVSVDVGVVATGMGCPSLDIVTTELIGLGARLLIRVGTAGSLSPRAVRAGDLVIASAAVRDEGASDRYVSRDYPAVADGLVVAALERAALTRGVAEHTFTGVVHSKDSLFAREFGFGPCRDANQDYMRHLEAMGVLATEMEVAHLLVLAAVHSSAVLPLARRAHSPDVVRAGAVLAIIGDDTPFAPPEITARAEELAIEVALDAVVELFRAGPPL